MASLGAIQAGLIAVPAAGAHDERVTAILADTAPTIILTTSAVAEAVTAYLQKPNSASAPAIIEVGSPGCELAPSNSSLPVKYSSSAA